jgi:hypothetical protein
MVAYAVMNKFKIPLLASPGIYAIFVALWQALSELEFSSILYVKVIPRNLPPETSYISEPSHDEMKKLWNVDEYFEFLKQQCWIFYR